MLQQIEKVSWPDYLTGPYYEKLENHIHGGFERLKEIAVRLCQEAGLSGFLTATIVDYGKVGGGSAVSPIVNLMRPAYDSFEVYVLLKQGVRAAKVIIRLNRKDGAYTNMREAIESAARAFTLEDITLEDSEVLPVPLPEPVQEEGAELTTAEHVPQKEDTMSKLPPWREGAKRTKGAHILGFFFKYNEGKVMDRVELAQKVYTAFGATFDSKQHVTNLLNNCVQHGEIDVVGRPIQGKICLGTKGLEYVAEHFIVDIKTDTRPDNTAKILEMVTKSTPKPVTTETPTSSEKIQLPAWREGVEQTKFGNLLMLLYVMCASGEVTRTQLLEKTNSAFPGEWGYGHVTLNDLITRGYTFERKTIAGHQLSITKEGLSYLASHFTVDIPQEEPAAQPAAEANVVMPQKAEETVVTPEPTPAPTVDSPWGWKTEERSLSCYILAVAYREYGKRSFQSTEFKEKVMETFPTIFSSLQHVHGALNNAKTAKYFGGVHRGKRGVPSILTISEKGFEYLKKHLVLGHIPEKEPEPVVEVASVSEVKPEVEILHEETPPQAPPTVVVAKEDSELQVPAPENGIAEDDLPALAIVIAGEDIPLNTVSTVAMEEGDVPETRPIVIPSHSLTQVAEDIPDIVIIQPASAETLSPDDVRDLTIELYSLRKEIEALELKQTRVNEIETKLRASLKL